MQTSSRNMCQVGVVPARSKAGRAWRQRLLLAAPGRSFPALPSMQGQRRTCVASASEENKPPQVTAISKNVDDDPSPYFDGFLRTFLLGLSMGGVFETLHIMGKLFSTSKEVGLPSLLATVASSVDQFAPLFVEDHVAALASWFLLYGIEVVAIMQIARRYPDDAEAARDALANLVTLPRKMLPLRLRNVKRLLLRLTPATAASAAATLPRLPAAPSTVTQPPQLMEFVDAPPAPEGTMVVPPAPAYPPTLPKGTKGSVTEKEVPAKGPVEAPQDAEKEDPSLSDDLSTRRRKKGLRPGQLDPHSNVIMRRRKELADRKAYLQNFWYAAAIAEKVTADEPLGIEMFGRKLTLFRDDNGRVHCISDVCPHRGAPLSKGWLAKTDGHTCVVCPYHGWAIDTKGYLRDVPAAEHEGEWPTAHPVVDVFPVEEKGGFIWLFFGSSQLPKEERPPVPYVPELDNPTWKPVYGEIEFDCGHWGVFENAIDMAHIHYLHSDSFGNDDQPEIKDMHVVTDAYSVTATFKLHNKPVNAMWEWSKVPHVEVTAKAFLPSTSVISFTLGNGLSFTTFVNTVPINENKTVNRFCLVRNIDWDVTGAFNWDGFDTFARQAMLRILSEDKAMIETLRPDLLEREISVKADLPQTAFRKLRQSYIDMGYGVPPEAVIERFRGDM